MRLTSKEKQVLAVALEEVDADGVGLVQFVIARLPNMGGKSVGGIFGRLRDKGVILCSSPAGQRPRRWTQYRFTMPIEQIRKMVK